MKMVRTAGSSQSPQRQDHSQIPVVFIEVGQFTKDGTDHRTYLPFFSSSGFDRRLMERMFRGQYAQSWV